ncbi:MULTISPECIES: uracil-DNA glycosylase family protein [Empedobacter]|uniref:Uracil-DNA glycosylase family protein n=1 Tax=Empedobacter falsenii TaxID=343874 RepID=A0A3R8SUT7_9FLAO|nr:MULTISPECIES: uracil-DNA glycosylase family protein [Empedobacter]MBY0067240.1 uracil-DNA glycosylase family protein [Empedobacter falsenii]MDH0658235.1 uracil-DNA glycosylase family protein [Empedobacter sp. GD03865]RRT93709.1 uracil-DNA glycosylase family protein [Empedobacter falsenii]RRT93864.1 uracil-DNA glycosylase family protein [Empedobacter falsenii]
MTNNFDKLIEEVRACKVCEPFLPLGANPIVQANPMSKIAIIGQAPGLRVHETGVPWNDASGNELRKWLNVTVDQFYNPELFALLPIGFCYPGKGKSGDLPPRKECAPLWHTSLLDEMKEIQLILLIGQYSQKYYLKNKMNKNITENILNFNDYLPDYFPLPHPSPRNFIWMNKNPWFKENVLPELKNRVKNIL